MNHSGELLEILLEFIPMVKRKVSIFSGWIFFFPVLSLPLGARNFNLY